VYKSRFVYVTYIRTTPEKLWEALLDPEFTRQYWSETWQDCEWKVGACWRLMIPDGRVADAGDVLEKSFLETGESLEMMRRWPKGMRRPVVSAFAYRGRA
jgi:uncharacterized protein YndB with AHSA1/START domain